MSIVDEHGDALIARKYAVPAEDDPTRVVERMVADARRALQQQFVASRRSRPGWRTRNVVPSWASGLDAEPTVTDYVEAIDRYHLLERLAKALELVESDSTGGTRTSTTATAQSIRWSSGS